MMRYESGSSCAYLNMKNVGIPEAP